MVLKLIVEKKLELGSQSLSVYPEKLSQRLIFAGGKRLRPMLLLLTYHAFVKKFASQQESLKLPKNLRRDDIQTLAAVAEWVHTATLFHDDVLDDSPTRRDKTAAHVLHGNKIAILVGDYVYAEAFHLLMQRGLMYPSQRLAQTIKMLVDGELLQHKMHLDRDLSQEKLISVSEAKTASLFSWCTEMGAWCAGVNADLIKQSQRLGANLGLAFQYADDMLDTYNDCEEKLGEERVQEWIESAPPLPIVIAAKSNCEVHSLWKDLAKLDAFKEQKNCVLELVRAASEKSVVEECKSWTESTLNVAREANEKTSCDAKITSAIDLISERARKGAQLAEEIS